MSEETVNQPAQRSNTTLWILLSLFMVPMVIAYGYFFFGEKPSISSNGELISPVVDIETYSMANASGDLLSREELTPKWRLYYFVGSDCNQVCQQNLYNMRQMNIALGKNRDRVEHVIVHIDKPGNALIDLIESEYPETIRVYSEKEKLPPQTLTNYIYLMDPLGNMMMRFPEQLNPKLILKDINKLLKISRIG